MPKGLLDIIVPHLNFSDFQIGIDSLRRNTPEGIINKIIFINQSEHEVKSVDIEVKTKNLGFAKACNAGIRLSDAKYCMVLNDDVVFFNPKWWQGIEDTFKDYPNALCVNPSSIQDPDGRGGKVMMEGYEYTEDMSDEKYDTLIKPWVIDGICMWSSVFNRELLDKLPGNIPGKAWFDERFFPGGAEDYDLNRRAYLAGMRCLGSNRSWVFHHWYKTKSPTTGQEGVKHDGETLYNKWGCTAETFDLYGSTGLKEVPICILRED